MAPTKSRRPINGLTDYDIYKKNVLDVLGRRYTSDEIREHAALPQNGEPVTAQEIAPFITTETGSPSIISIKTTAPDEQFAKDLLDACNTVLLNDLRPQVDKGYLNYLGQTVSVEKESSTYTEMTALKYAIAYCVAGIVLACIVIFIITLAQPTINRKSDFEKYGIPVIGEMYPSRGRKVARS